MPRNLVEHFSIIEDPRRGRVAYDLTEILVIVTCALFSEVETFVDIAAWAEYKEAWLRRFLPLKNGVPSHDTINRVFRQLDPKEFATVFADWVSEVLPTFGHVAIDGKSLRGVRRAHSNPIHLVSAFATEAGLTLAQHQVGHKGSELDGAKALIEALELRGCLVSLDALGCQTDLAQQICARGADYLLCVKGNQPKLRQALEAAFAESPKANVFEQTERGHGRCSTRQAEAIPNTGVVDTRIWMACQALGRIQSYRVEGAQAPQSETRSHQFSRTHIRATGQSRAPALGDRK